MLKQLAKPAFLKLLQGMAEVDLRRRGGRPHGLPFPVVVSATSYPKRYDTLAPTMKSLLAQNVRADVTVLWIARADMATLPAAVRALERRGLEIREAEDLRSYKKIIPALAAYPDAAIITADDDVYYPRSWLRQICEGYRADRREVLCHRARRMRRQGDGFAPYKSWEFLPGESAAPNLFATGVGGIFYPPGIFHRDVADIPKLLALCPTTDDVWLNWMARLSGATVRKVGGRSHFYEWSGSQAVGLQNVNFVDGANNDLQIANIVRSYGIPGSIQ